MIKRAIFPLMLFVVIKTAVRDFFSTELCVPVTFYLINMEIHHAELICSENRCTHCANSEVGLHIRTQK